MKLKSHRRTGAIIPLLAVVITVILAIAALTINGSWLMYNRVNAQNTADLSSRSALVKVIGDTQFNGRIDRARDLAVRMYDLNIDRNSTGIDRDRIRFGSVEDTSAFEPVFTETNSNRAAISAVHVDTPTTAEQRGVKVFLSQFLGGRQTVDIVSEATSSTRPLDLILCLDASRSMAKKSTTNEFPAGGGLNKPPLAGSRWFELKETVALFLNAMQQVNPNARIGLVTFGGGASEEIVQKTGKGVRSPLDDEFARLDQALTLVISNEANQINDTLNSYGADLPALGLGTSIIDGLQISLDSFDDSPSSKHIILLSDGDQAAVGNRPAPINAAYDAADAGVIVHSISFGGNIGVLSSIAEKAKGSNFTALNDDQLKEAFATLLGRFRTQLVD